ncbi:hypothetical protein PHISP_08302 [Aspergillus sp. HF37]|nr:hypothetical protein PHISP_08302 [Aspergillus sp. HF37]
MAMFVSLEVPFKVRRAPRLFHSADEATQKSSKSRRRLQPLSEMYSPSESDDAREWTFQSKNAIPKPDVFALQPRKAVSLNDVGSERERKWPGNVVSPVSPTVPRYPPPGLSEEQRTVLLFKGAFRTGKAAMDRMWLGAWRTIRFTGEQSLPLCMSLSTRMLALPPPNMGRRPTPKKNLPLPILRIHAQTVDQTACMPPIFLRPQATCHQYLREQ